MLKELLLSPLYATYGLWILISVAVRVGCELVGLPTLLRTHVTCRTCGTPNSLHDRWVCSDCGAEYLGAVHTCGLCRAAASWFPCARCRASIPVRSP